MAMSYIVQRNHRFYVVTYNGRDPITGRERRRWHPAGSDARDSEEVRRRIDRQRLNPSCAASLGGFMSTTWLRTKRTLARPTENRYRWMIDHNIAPRVGTIRLDALRPEDLDACYGDLTANGGCRQGLAAKSVLELHRVICNALDLAVDRQLIDLNPSRRGRPPKPTSRPTVPAIWNAPWRRPSVAPSTRRRSAGR
jgi:integrase